MPRPEQRPPILSSRDVAPKRLIDFSVWILFLGLLAAVSARGADIVIIRTSDAEPYVQAGAALQDQLIQEHQTVRNLLAKDVSEQGISAGIGKANVVVAVGTPAARWLQKQLPAEVKLIYCMVSNAANEGLLEGRPSTGVTTDIAISEQIKLIAEALPKARSVGMLFRSDVPESKRVLESLGQAMPAGWSVQAVAVNDFPSIAGAIGALIDKRVDVIWTSADPKIFDTAAVRTLLLAALRAKIPVWGFSPAFVRAGALIGVGVDPAAQGKQAADLVVESLSGHLRAGQRVVAPEQFQIAVNLIVARQLELEIPESLTQRAVFVFQPEEK
jgi:putative ABC transport system substrate-binding protein